MKKRNGTPEDLLNFIRMWSAAAKLNEYIADSERSRDIEDYLKFNEKCNDSLVSTFRSLSLSFTCCCCCLARQRSMLLLPTPRSVAVIVIDDMVFRFIMSVASNGKSVEFQRHIQPVCWNT